MVLPHYRKQKSHESPNLSFNAVLYRQTTSKQMEDQYSGQEKAGTGPVSAASHTKHNM